MGTYTLLRYPGGKTRAVKHILPFFLESGETELVSPFFGGGAIEFALINKGWKVRGYDNFAPVVNFWQRAIEDPNRIADIVEMYRPVDPKAYRAMQSAYERVDCPYTRAAIYYVLTRTSHSGNGFTGGITKWSADGTPDDPRLKDSTVAKLRAWTAPGLTVEEQDFNVTIRKNLNTILYCDPPYIDVGDCLYSEGSFDHAGMAYYLRRRGKWILSYGDHPEVYKLFPDYRIIPLQWKYGMQRKQGNELLIFSHDLAHLAPFTEEEQAFLDTEYPSD